MHIYETWTIIAIIFFVQRMLIFNGGKLFFQKKKPVTKIDLTNPTLVGHFGQQSFENNKLFRWYFNHLIFALGING